MEHDKKAKKRKHAYKDDEEDEVYQVFLFIVVFSKPHVTLDFSIHIGFGVFKDIKHKKKTKDKKSSEGKKAKKEEEDKWKW